MNEQATIKQDRAIDKKNVLEGLNLSDVEFIELSSDGNELKYHLSKKIIKDGITALVSFTIFENVETEKRLNPIVSTPSKSRISSNALGDSVQVYYGEDLNALGVNTLEEALNSMTGIHLMKNTML